MTNATAGYVFIRHEYPEQIHALREEIMRAERLGACGENIFNSGRNFPVEGFESPPSSERDAARFRQLLEPLFPGQVMVRQTRGEVARAAGRKRLADLRARNGARASRVTTHGEMLVAKLLARNGPSG